MLDVKELSCGYGRKVVVNRFSLSLGDSEILCLPQERTASGRRLCSGPFLACSRPLARGNPSGRRGYVGMDELQEGPVDRLRAAGPRASVSVPSGRRRGHGKRFRRLRAFEAPSVKDRDSARAVLDSLGIAHLADRVYTEISGGERQLVLVARALVQKPRILVLDEPTSSLDFANQTLVLERIKDLAPHGGMGIIMTTHSPAHAFLCSTKVTLMGKNGWMANGGKR